MRNRDLERDGDAASHFPHSAGSTRTAVSSQYSPSVTRHSAITIQPHSAGSTRTQGSLPPVSLPRINAIFPQSAGSTRTQGSSRPSTTVGRNNVIFVRQPSNMSSTFSEDGSLKDYRCRSLCCCLCCCPVPGTLAVFFAFAAKYYERKGDMSLAIQYNAFATWAMAAALCIGFPALIVMIVLVLILA